VPIAAKQCSSNLHDQLIENHDGIWYVGTQVEEVPEYRFRGRDDGNEYKGRSVNE
jgi:hypothetical protein